ncbi:hypothetical protein SLA2020_245200 [Shorea laevis]
MLVAWGSSTHGRGRTVVVPTGSSPGQSYEWGCLAWLAWMTLAPFPSLSHTRSMLVAWGNSTHGRGRTVVVPTGSSPGQSYEWGCLAWLAWMTLALFPSLSHTCSMLVAWGSSTHGRGRTVVVLTESSPGQSYEWGCFASLAWMTLAPFFLFLSIPRADCLGWLIWNAESKGLLADDATTGAASCSWLR